MAQSAVMQNSMQYSATDDSILNPLNELHCHTVIFMFSYWYKKKQNDYLKAGASFGSTPKSGQSAAQLKKQMSIHLQTDKENKNRYYKFIKRILDQRWNETSDIGSYAQILSERILVKNFGEARPVYDLDGETSFKPTHSIFNSAGNYIGNTGDSLNSFFN